MTVEPLRSAPAFEASNPSSGTNSEVEQRLRAEGIGLESVSVVKLARRAAANPAFDTTVQAEQSVIGALLVDGRALRRIPALQVGHFSSETNRRIFQAMRDTAEDDGLAAIDIITIGARLANGAGIDGELVAYLGSLAQNIPSALNIHLYADLVIRQAQRRELAAIGTDLAERAAAPGADLAELKRQVAESLTRIVPALPRAHPLDWTALSAKQPPPRSWVEKGWIGLGHITMLVGPGGIGKTLLAQQMGSCYSLGRSIIDEVTARFKVLMWACEDDHDELWRRQVAIGQWLESDVGEFQNLVLVPRHGLENALVVAEMGRVLYTPLLDELREQASDVGAQVVILDNVAQLYGASENDRHAVTAFMNALAGALPGRAIVLLAHPARSAGSEFSGSSAWENCARTRLYLGTRLPDQKLEADEHPADDIRYLARRKANYSNRDWRKFTFREGVLVPEAVDTAGGIVGHLRAQAAERAVLAALERLQGMSLDPTDGTRSPRFLPRLMQEYKLTEKCSKAEVTEAMRRLMVDGRLVRTVVGKYDNRSPMYGLRRADPVHK